MSTSRTRLAIVAGTTMALVLTGASIVTAQTPNTAPGGGDGIGAHMPGAGGRGFGRGFRDNGPRDRVAEVFGSRIDGLVSQEVVRIDADGNILTDRVQRGTVSAVVEGSITIDLATGESATVATDANTSAYAWDLTDRPAREEVALSAIAVGADVLVWSESQDDGSFLAGRVAIVPEASAETETETETTTPEPSPAVVG